MWDFETIDNADITEDNTVFEMEPLAEIKVNSLVNGSLAVIIGATTAWIRCQH